MCVMATVKPGVQRLHGGLRQLWLLLLFVCLSGAFMAQAQAPVLGRCELNSGWQMQFGPTLREDAAWLPMGPHTSTRPPDGEIRNGIAWFRCPVQGSSEPMALALLARWRAVEVYWDGRQIGTAGHIGALTTYGPRDQYLVFPVPPGPGLHRLDLKVQIGTHDWLTHPIGGIALETPVLFGPEAWIRDRAQSLTAVESWSRLKIRIPYLVLVVVFVVMGLWYLQFYARRKSTGHLWFGLVLLMVGIQQFGVSGIPKDWPVPSFRVSQFLFAQYYLTCVVFMEFLRSFVGENTQRWLRVYQWSFLVPLLLLFLLPPDVSMWFARRIGSALALPILGVFIGSLIQAQRGKRPDAPYLLCGALVLMLGGLAEVANFMGLVKGVNAFGYAFLVFLACMAALVNDRNARAYEKSEKLSQDLAAQIVERERMFREIHDGFSAQICEAVLLVDGLVNQSDAGVTTKQLPMVGSLLDQCLGELRDLMWVLRDEQVTLSDLVLHLRGFCVQRTSPGRLELDFTSSLAEPDHRISRTLRFHLFRILQELVTNTLKHARARHVVIRIQELDAQLAIRFSDDGIGFDEKATGHGHGLELLRQRCEEIRGFLHLRTSIGMGLQVTLHVPLNEKAISKRELGV